LDVYLKQQGKSARETCPIWILNSLLREEKMSFEELIKAGEASYSRGTINKYLSEEYEKSNINREGRRGKYFLTLKGKNFLLNYSHEKLETANLQWLETIANLSQEGHARILTKNELEKMGRFWQDLSRISKFPVELDDEGLLKLGITEGQIKVIDMLKKLDEKWKKEGLNVINRVQGKNGFYIIKRD